MGTQSRAEQPSAPGPGASARRRRLRASRLAVPGPTLRQVAERAGVSVWTASKVLNRRRREAGIRPDTAERVRSAARDLGYHPNVCARSLRAEKTLTIGLVLHEHSYLRLAGFAQFLAGAAERLGEDHYSVVTLVSNPEHQDELGGIHYTARAFNNSVDGLLIHDQLLPEQAYRELEDRGVPFVAVNRLIPGLEHRCLLHDDEGAMAWAAEHLISRGYRRICFPRDFKEVEMRHRQLRGLERAVRAHAADGVTAWHEPIEEGITPASLRAMVGHAGGPLGFILITQELLADLYASARPPGLRIPQDIGVVSLYIGATMSNALNPPVTYVDFDGMQSGRWAAEGLLAALSGREVALPMLPFQATILRSCGETPEEGG